MRADGSHEGELVTPLVRLLDRALRRLGDLGDQEGPAGSLPRRGLCWRGRGHARLSVSTARFTT